MNEPHENGHCTQCDTPYCPRHGECQTLDISRIPKDADYIVSNVNSGLTPVCQVGNCEAHADTIQDAIDAAAKKFREQEGLDLL